MNAPTDDTTTPHMRLAELVAKAYAADPSPPFLEVALEDLDDMLTDFAEADESAIDLSKQLDAYSTRAAKAEEARDKAVRLQVAAEKRNVALAAIAREAINALEDTRRLFPVDAKGKPDHPDVVAEGYADGLRAAVKAIGEGIER